MQKSDFNLILTWVFCLPLFLFAYFATEVALPAALAIQALPVDTLVHWSCSLCSHSKQFGNSLEHTEMS